jgi:hypothetical protein
MMSGAGKTSASQDERAAPLVQTSRWRILWGDPALRALARKNLRSPAEFDVAGRHYMCHPVMLFAYAFPVSMLLIGLFIPEFAAYGLSPFISNLLTAAKVGVFWLSSWLLLGRFAYVMMRTGIPFIYAPLLLWVIAVTASQLVSLALIPGFDWSTSRTLRQAVVIVPGTLATVYFAQGMLRQALGHSPDLVPIWHPLRSWPVPLMRKLPQDHRNRVRRMHAANQYVEVVTETGAVLLRMTLTQAVAMVPPDMGWFCHRSLWINRDEVVALTYVKGQPQITDREGRVYPISRSHGPIIRDWLASRKR